MNLKNFFLVPLVALFLAGCDDEDDAELQLLQQELDTAKTELVALRARVQASNILVENQMKLIEAAQLSTTEAIAICGTSNSDTELKSLIAGLTAQCVEAVSNVSQEISGVKTQIASIDNSEDVDPVVEPLDCEKNPSAEGCPQPSGDGNGIVGGADPVDTCDANPYGPGCEDPIQANDPPPSDVDEGGGQEFESAILLAGAYLACEYYSAGTCGLVVSLVGLQLGMGEGEVREKSKPAYEGLSEDIKKRGISIPGPDGRPIVLKADLPFEVRKAVQKYNALSAQQQQDFCTVLEVFSSEVSAVRDLLDALGSPYEFSTASDKRNTLKIAGEIDRSLTNMINRIPVKGDANTDPIPCG
ncbi:hypothetical protein D1821_19055 (plasmid) [Phaeobacter inhibens]|uniref:hypothetical protein n=1 Tax=Phaeobacter TaxID=302485 RepID=UPI000160CD0B|nr:hypothetical protein [Phaeobacter inhibens]AFO89653.1 hypothetical protein PGA2_95p180 [Phaeobacter inhibens 2.10]AXT44584.1 hypothetical protein D1821_19055 [Phaeobacter inhibens]